MHELRHLFFFGIITIDFFRDAPPQEQVPQGVFEAGKLLGKIILTEEDFAREVIEPKKQVALADLTVGAV